MTPLRHRMMQDLQLRGYADRTVERRKDRYVPLPDATLALLRAHWRTHRNPLWLFPTITRSHDGGLNDPAVGPISILVAARLLADRARTVEAVAHDLGFPSAVPLRRALRRYAGCRPGELRNSGLEIVLDRFATSLSRHKPRIA